MNFNYKIYCILFELNPYHISVTEISKSLQYILPVLIFSLLDNIPFPSVFWFYILHEVLCDVKERELMFSYEYVFIVFMSFQRG